MLFQYCPIVPVLLLSLPLCAAAASASPIKKTSPSSVSLAGNMQDVTFSLPDPKLPGKLLYYLRFADGNGQLESDGFHGNMTKIWARLYQKGVPAAVLTAPYARGGSTNKIVVVTATGGVVIKSLTEPGTKLSADKVVWYPNRGTDNVVATGHVFYQNGKTGATMTGPQATADTKLKTLHIVSGHASATL